MKRVILLSLEFETMMVEKKFMIQGDTFNIKDELHLSLKIFIMFDYTF